MNSLNYKGTLNFLKKHCKLLCIVFVVSGLVSAGLSLLLTNYYKSQALLLPSAVNSQSKSLLNEGDRLDLIFMVQRKKVNIYWKCLVLGQYWKRLQ